ncbi:hypothetical protein V1522DRAFT_156014 [Lipomyces starkeyi]
MVDESVARRSLVTLVVESTVMNIRNGSCCQRYLAIPASGASVARLYNSGPDLLGLRRNSLSAETINGIILKSCNLLFVKATVLHSDHYEPGGQRSGSCICIFVSVSVVFCCVLMFFTSHFVTFESEQCDWLNLIEFCTRI